MLEIGNYKEANISVSLEHGTWEYLDSVFNHT